MCCTPSINSCAPNTTRRRYSLSEQLTYYASILTYLLKMNDSSRTILYLRDKTEPTKYFVCQTPVVTQSNFCILLTEIL